MSATRWVGSIVLGLAGLACGGQNEGGGPAQPGSRRFASIAVGDAGGCVVVREGGAVLCWDGYVVSIPEGSGEPTKPAREVPEARGLRAISVGHMACGITAEDRVRCWTLPQYFSDGGADPVIEDMAFADVTSVAVGPRHACAVTGGSVACWGDNVYGALDGTGESRDAPVIVPGVEGAVAVAVGEQASCALKSGGEVVCWGSTPFEARTPTPRPELAGATQIAVGEGSIAVTYVCALRGEGRVTCVGAPYEMRALCKSNADACASETPPTCALTYEDCPADVDPAEVPFQAYTIVLPDDQPRGYTLQIQGAKIAISLGVALENESMENFFFPRAPMTRCGGNGRALVYDLAAGRWDTTCALEPVDVKGNERIFCWGLGSTYSGNSESLCGGAEILLPP